MNPLYVATALGSGFSPWWGVPVMVLGLSALVVVAFKFWAWALS